MPKKLKKANHQLRLQRKNRGWTQARLAEAIGADTTLISRWECGERNPDISYQEKLCLLFEKNATELGFLEENPTSVDASDVFTVVRTHIFPMEEAQRVTSASLLFTTTPLVENLIQDWSIWFGIKLAQLISIVDHWQGKALSCEQLQATLDLEIARFNAMKPHNHDSKFHLSRRQTLITIVMLPTAINGLFHQEVVPTLVIEKLLTRCAASITACWHLLGGSDLSLIEQVLSTYLLTLTSLAQQPSLYQKTAAKLATQAYRLYGIVALHRNNLQAREYYCQKALYFSNITENDSLIASAQISLASTCYYMNNPAKAARTYQKALAHEEKLPLLQRSRLYAELAVVSAQQRNEKESLHALEMARRLYPEHPENDPSFLYAEFSPASMILEEGLTYLALAHHFPDRRYDHKAHNSFVDVERLAAESYVSERIFFEIMNNQAETALVLRNLELFRAYVSKGIEGANKLNSKQRRQEIIDAYTQAHVIWPREIQVEEIHSQLFSPVEGE